MNKREEYILKKNMGDKWKQEYSKMDFKTVLKLSLNSDHQLQEKYTISRIKYLLNK